MPKPCPYFTGWSLSFREHHRVLHTLDVAVDNGLPGTSGWQGPIEITCNGSVAMPSFPIHYKCMGGWFVLKSIAHGSKCPIELCLPIDVGRKFSWLLKTCSEFSLHLRDKEIIQIIHVHMQASGVRFVKTVNINFTDNLPTFPITKSLWSHWKLLLICLVELGFGFDHPLPRGKPVGKSPYYHSFDRIANWRVKDSIHHWCKKLIIA